MMPGETLAHEILPGIWHIYSSSIIASAAAAAAATKVATSSQQAQKATAPNTSSIGTPHCTSNPQAQQPTTLIPTPHFNTCITDVDSHSLLPLSRNSPPMVRLPEH
jgi:hypothetical protein